ncbi:MAG: hypothetical protein QM786_04060 [Breznakibacter sp.]
MMPPTHKQMWLLAVLAGVLLLFAIISNTGKPIDWSHSYSLEDKIPLGNKILYELMPVAFPEQEIAVYRKTLYQSDTEYGLANNNYLIINNQYLPDSLETAYLLSNINAGCRAFVAARTFSSILADTLHIEVSEKFNINIPLNRSDSLTLNFTNPQLKTSQGYVFRSAYDNVYFSKIDTAQTTILGTDQKGRPNFISIKIGEGELLIHTSPMAFTNYHMVTGNHSEYAFKCLSYLPVRKTVWDEYFKAKPRPKGSFLGIILQSEALHRAWLLFLGILTIYLAFEAKRRQRAIPVVAPPANTSLQFIDTIGRLYYSRKNHWDIARKKYTYFTDFVRSTYYINLNEIDKDGIAELSAKAHIPISAIDQIIKTGKALDQTNRINESDLIAFNQIIEFFYHHRK